MITRSRIIRVSEELGSLTGGYLAYREKSGFGGYLAYGLAFFLLGKVAGTMVASTLVKDKNTETSRLLASKSIPIKFVRTI